MKKTALIVGTLIITLGSVAQIPIGNEGKKDCSLIVEEIDRHFIVYKPTVNSSDLLPVVFMFHGTSGNGERFYNISGWKEKADKEGFIAVFPSALRYRIVEEGIIKNTTKWNDGRLSTIICEGELVKDDALFFREMVLYLKTNYKIDERRIYASGFSNGANFVSRLTLEASDILAATAMSAGFLQDSTFMAVELIPSFLTVGNMEPTLMSDGKPIVNDMKALESQPLAKIVYRMVDKLQLEREYKIESRPYLTLYKFEKSKSAGSNIFYFGLVDSLAHKYPNGINHPTINADLFWDYFVRFRK
jgi:polyhydroxybutyrate depolymerase